MKMHSPSPLRIRPPLARVPRRLAANPARYPGCSGLGKDSYLQSTFFKTLDKTPEP